MFVVLAITAVLVYRTKMSKSDVLFSGAIGLLLGIGLDYVLGYRFEMWAYKRHPYWGIDYWAVLPMMWALFGVYVVIAWRKIRWLTIPIMIGLHEVYGVVRNSWEYSVDWPIVFIGWIPLVITIVLMMGFIERRLCHEMEQ